MRLCCGIDPRLRPDEVAEQAALLESVGYDAVHLAETVHDPLAAALLVAEATQSIVIRTSVVVAFARSPTLLAYQALDAQRISDGRFELGLGTQIRQVIEDRYAMTFSPPRARLRDYVIAIRSLMAAFISGEAATVETEHVTVSRVPAYFNPGPLDGITPPPVLVGAVRPRMLEMAGEHGDGVITHPTNSDSLYLRSVVYPAIAKGAALAGRDPSAVRIVASPNVVTGPDWDSLQGELTRQRKLLGFLLTTPAYSSVLERLGCPELGEQLRAQLRDHGDAQLGELIPDFVLGSIVPAAPFEELPELLTQRYGGLVDDLVVRLPPGADGHPRWSAVLASLKEIPGRR